MKDTIAIVADIHGNLEALSAVMSDVAEHDVSEVYCLGDVVGYGPNPCECVDIAMEFSVCLMGNHDKLALEGEADSVEAMRSLMWTRRQLSFADGDTNQPDRRRTFLRGLPLTHVESGMLFVHGSPRDPLNEYMFPEYVFDQRKMESIFALVDDCCFVGHTHLPGIFTSECEFVTPQQINLEWKSVSGSKLICNVGSVGQPRDEDSRACYCLYDGNTIRFRRVDYDIATTARKLEELFPPE